MGMTSGGSFFKSRRLAFSSMQIEISPVRIGMIGACPVIELYRYVENTRIALEASTANANPDISVDDWIGSLLFFRTGNESDQLADFEFVCVVGIGVCAIWIGVVGTD